MPKNTDELVDLETLKNEIEILLLQADNFKRDVSEAEKLMKDGKIMVPRYGSWQTACERLSSVTNAFSKAKKKLIANHKASNVSEAPGG